MAAERRGHTAQAVPGRESGVSGFPVLEGVSQGRGLLVGGGRESGAGPQSAMQGCASRGNTEEEEDPNGLLELRRVDTPALTTYFHTPAPKIVTRICYSEASAFPGPQGWNHY